MSAQSLQKIWDVRTPSNARDRALSRADWTLHRRVVANDIDTTALNEAAEQPRSYRDSIAYQRSNRMRPDGSGPVFPWRVEDMPTVFGRA